MNCIQQKKKLRSHGRTHSTYPRYFFIFPSHHQDTIALFPSTKRNTGSNKPRRSSFYLNGQFGIQKTNKGGRSFHVKKGRSCNPCKKNLKHLFCCFLPPPRKCWNQWTKHHSVLGEFRSQQPRKFQWAAKWNFTPFQPLPSASQGCHAFFLLRLLLKLSNENTPFRCGC